MISFKNQLKYLYKISVAGAIGVIGLSSLINLYNNRGLIKESIKPDSRISTNLGGSKSDSEWAQKLLEGGYILHFRHAERDKWIDVQMYDALESDVHDNGLNQTRFAENDYFEKAVCLNERGNIQAKAMGELLEKINFPIGPVVSSPSCRSRQTADLAFGGYEDLHRDLVHDGPYAEKRDERNQKLLDFFLSLPVEQGKNTIVSSHNSVIRADMLSNNDDYNLKLEEGGFYVLSKDGDKLYLEHEFHNFNSFIRQFFIR